jgi:hypothetical protein
MFKLLMILFSCSAAIAVPLLARAWAEETPHAPFRPDHPRARAALPRKTPWEVLGRYPAGFA